MSHPTQIPRSQHIFWGSQISDLLVLWLNRTTGTSGNKRISELLRKLFTFSNLARQNRHPPTTAAPWSLEPDPQSFGFPWEGRIIYGVLDFPSAWCPKVNDAADVINRAIRRYKLRPKMVFACGGRPLFSWEPTRGSLGSGNDLLQHPSGEEYMFSE